MPTLLGPDTVLINNRSLTLSIRYYDDEPLWGIRRLAWPVADRWAIDFGTTSLIVEMWFIRDRFMRRRGYKV